MAEPKVGLVTVTYNSGEVLEGFFKSLWGQQYANFICVVVDNQSRDNTVEQLLQQTDTRLQLIVNDQNLGVAEGNNQGILRCLEQGCDYVLLINNDTEFEADLLENLLAASLRTGYAIVVPKMYYYDPPDMIWCAGGYFVKWAAWHNGHYGDREIDHGQYDEAIVIEYCPTCCMLIRRDVFQAIGVMDPDYFVYYDDVDFCLRALKAGICLYYVPEAKLWHKVSSLTGGEQSDFAVNYLSRNRALLIDKNFSGLNAQFFHAVNLAYFVWRRLRRLDDSKLMLKRIGLYRRALKSGPHE